MVCCCFFDLFCFILSYLSVYFMFVFFIFSCFVVLFFLVIYVYVVFLVLFFHVVYRFRAFNGVQTFALQILSRMPNSYGTQPSRRRHSRKGSSPISEAVRTAESLLGQQCRSRWTPYREKKNATRQTDDKTKNGKKNKTNTRTKKRQDRS